MLRDIDYFYGLNCTINTTENCNLRCKYCYEINKNEKTIDFEKCKKFIDLVFSDKIIEKNEDICKITDDPIGVGNWNNKLSLPSAANSGADVYHGRVFDFIGGDSLINPELLDKILTYINTINFNAKNKLLYGWRASITSNGTLFEREDVRNFCEKWKDDLSITISIDGCPEIHDKNRVYPDGSGSMDTILKWWPWYKKTFPLDSLGTKSTCNKDSIPYLYDSLKFMHEELGLVYIRQNFIMEDMHLTSEDLKEFDRQMEKCTEYYFDHYNEFFWGILGDEFMKLSELWPYEKDFSEDFYITGRCGSGIMPALGVDGNIYPCFRWLNHTQSEYSAGSMCVGNIDEGFINADNFKKVALGAIRCNCTKEEKCRDCKYEHACPYCIGGCYSEYGDFIRTTHICEIIKIQAKWAEILLKQLISSRKLQEVKEIYSDKDNAIIKQSILSNINNANSALNFNKLDIDNIDNAHIYKGVINNLYSLVNAKYLWKAIESQGDKEWLT